VTSVGAEAGVYAGTGVCDGVCTLALESDSDQDVSVGSEVATLLLYAGSVQHVCL